VKKIILDILKMEDTSPESGSKSPKTKIILISLGALILVVAVALGVYFGVDNSKDETPDNNTWDHLLDKKYKIGLQYDNTDPPCLEDPWDQFGENTTTKFKLNFDESNRDDLVFSYADYTENPLPCEWSIEKVENMFCLFVKLNGTKHYIKKGAAEGDRNAMITTTNASEAYDITNVFIEKDEKLASTNTEDSLQCYITEDLKLHTLYTGKIPKSPDSDSCQPLTVVLSLQPPTSAD
jgi:hypothetical protein